MTDQEINEEIAKAVGTDDRWLICKCGWFYRAGGCGYTNILSEAWKLPLHEAKKHEYLHGDEPVTLKKAPLVDYCNDLNAMHEAEKVLDDEQWLDYARYTSDTLGVDHIKVSWRLVVNVMHATAHQRAEAFLRTLNKWKD